MRQLGILHPQMTHKLLKMSLNICLLHKWQLQTALSGLILDEIINTTLQGPAQGFWYVDPKTGKLTEGKDSYSRPQLRLFLFNQLMTI